MKIIETPLDAATMSDDAEPTPEGYVGEADGGYHPVERTEPDERANLLNEQKACSDLRMDRIKAIQSRLADSTYNTSAGDVAAKVITRLLQA